VVACAMKRRLGPIFTPEIDPGTLLASAQFIDAYRVAVGVATLDARKAAEKCLRAGRAGSRRC
jgi:hypothetical protein